MRRQRRLPGFRNCANDAHVAELAELWNVEPASIPHYGPPTHAMQIFRYAEQGSIRFLWISATNPAVSLPELHRIRSILAKENVFVVQDLFLTAELAGAGPRRGSCFCVTSGNCTSRRRAPRSPGPSWARGRRPSATASSSPR